MVGPVSSSSPVLLHTPDTAPEAPNSNSNTRSKPPGLGNQVAALLLPTPEAKIGDAYAGDRGGPTAPTKARAAGQTVHLADAAALLGTPTSRDHKGPDPSRVAAGDHRSQLDAQVAMLPTPRATDGTKGGPNQAGSSGDLMLPSAVQPERMLPTPTAQPARHGETPDVTANGYGSNLWDLPTLLPEPSPDQPWGPYEAAVRRWEAVTGSAAPPPTEPGKTGAPRLSPRFVEWLMGLPAGWVTDVEGVSRNAQLRILGNGVVPQQAAAALRLLLLDNVAP